MADEKKTRTRITDADRLTERRERVAKAAAALEKEQAALKALETEIAEKAAALAALVAK